MHTVNLLSQFVVSVLFLVGTTMEGFSIFLMLNVDIQQTQPEVSVFKAYRNTQELHDSTITNRLNKCGWFGKVARPTWILGFLHHEQQHVWRKPNTSYELWARHWKDDDLGFEWMPVLHLKLGPNCHQQDKDPSTAANLQQNSCKTHRAAAELRALCMNH